MDNSWVTQSELAPPYELHHAIEVGCTDAQGSIWIGSGQVTSPHCIRIYLLSLCPVALVSGALIALFKGSIVFECGLWWCVHTLQVSCRYELYGA